MENNLKTISNIPFSYIALLVLTTLIENDKKIITKEKLLVSCKLLIKSFKNNVYFQKELNGYGIIITMDYENLETELDVFLNDYQFLFKTTDLKELTIEDDISLDDLSNYLEEIEISKNINDFQEEFRELRVDKTLKKYLNINKLANIFKEYYKNELYLEQLYLKLLKSDNKESIQKEIKLLLDLRNKFLGKLYSRPELYRAYHAEFNNILKEKIIPYQDNYPVDITTINASKFYKTNPTFFNDFDDDYDFLEDDLDLENDEEVEEFNPDNFENNDIMQINSEDFDELIKDLNQYAIFDNISLANFKINEDLANLIIQITNKTPPQIDNNLIQQGIFKFIYTVNYEDALLFYLLYIDKLDKLIKDYEDLELEVTKMRLIYALDNTNLNLFLDNQVENLLNTFLNLLNQDEIDKDCYNFLNLESYFFLIDIFENKENSPNDILKKLAFISTYYYLTGDKKIDEIMKNYISYNNYFTYYKIIHENKLKEKSKIKL